MQLSLNDYHILRMMISRPGELLTRDELRAVMGTQCRLIEPESGHGALTAAQEDRERLRGALPVLSARNQGYVFTGQGRLVE